MNTSNIAFSQSILRSAMPFLKSNNKFSSLISDLIPIAETSKLNYQLAACVLKKNRKIMQAQPNAHGTGYGGSRHAELRAALSLLGSKNIKLSNGTWHIPEEMKKKNKIYSMFVIRIASSNSTNHNKVLVNARPCHKCLTMMKSLGFKEVHYSTDNGEIVTEKINDMISVHASYVAIKIDHISKSKVNISNDTGYHNIVNKQSYYDNLIKSNVPDSMKEINFMYFICHNLKHVQAKYNIKHDMDKVMIINSSNIVIKVINIT